MYKNSIDSSYETISSLKNYIIERQEYWKNVDPQGHITGHMVKIRRLSWFYEVLPRLDESLITLEELRNNMNYLD